jgi:hypothetical protein
MQQEVDKMKAIASDAPSEIKGDLNTLIGVLQQYADAVKNAHGNTQALMAALPSLEGNTQKLQAAAQHLEQYAVQHCGYKPTSTPTT